MLRARVATVPDAKDVAGTPGLGSSSALGVTGVMGHPGVATAIADSALCLLVGTQLSVTARAGLDDALASVQTYSIGSAAPFVPCTHVHTEDLRGSLTTADAGAERQRPSDPRAGAGPGAEDRAATAAARRPRCALPRRDGCARSDAAGRRRHRRRRRKHRRVGDPPSACAPRRAIHRRAGHGRHGIQLRRRRGCGARAQAADRGDRRRRLILHARHGDSHRAAVPPARDVPAVRQPRACDVRDPRATVLRRSLQLQPVRPKPAGRGPGGHVSRSGLRRRRRRSTICPARCRRHSMSTARRSSASSARPTKSHHSQTFSARRP